MRIILSPAKKMVREDYIPYRDMPAFLPHTQQLLDLLCSKSTEELKAIWKCSDAIVQENLERIERMDLYKGLSPALFSYEGIAYRYMAPSAFTQQELEYVQEHLRILSGFYGMLRPFDGVTPYRLEMGAKFAVGEHKDLYKFWGSTLADGLCDETDLLINLASKEYSKAVIPHLAPSVRVVTCSFVVPKNGKLVEQSTACKMARGEMVRYMVEQCVMEPEALKQFNHQGYRYCAERSDDQHYVFIKEA